MPLPTLPHRRAVCPPTWAAAPHLGVAIFIVAVAAAIICTEEAERDQPTAAPSAAPAVAPADAHAVAHDVAHADAPDVAPACISGTGGVCAHRYRSGPSL